MLNQLHQIHYCFKPAAQMFCLSFTQQQKREGKKETNCLIFYMKDCSTYISLKIQKQLIKILSNLVSSCPMVSSLFPNLSDCFCPQKFPWKQLLLPYFDHVTYFGLFQAPINSTSSGHRQKPSSASPFLDLWSDLA